MLFSGRTALFNFPTNSVVFQVLDIVMFSSYFFGLGCVCVDLKSSHGSGCEELAPCGFHLYFLYAH